MQEVDRFFNNSIHPYYQNYIQSLQTPDNHVYREFAPINISTTLPDNVTDITTDNATKDDAREVLALSVLSQSVLIILYSLTTALSVIGNAIVIMVFAFGRRSRTDLRIFLINLACADLVMAIFCMPFTFTMTMLKNWIFTEPMCPIVLYMQTVSVTASVCTNMSIGIDRYWVVTFPLRSRITKSRSKVVILMIWIFCLALSSVQIIVGRSKVVTAVSNQVIRDCNEVWPEPSETWRRSYSFFILFTTYLFPLIVLSLTYGIVCKKLWQRTTPGNADQVRDAHQLKSKRKVIKMLVVVVMLFGICWLPLHVFILLLDLCPSLLTYASGDGENLFTAIYYTVHWLAMSNSFVNPIVYGFLNDSFKHDFRRLLRQWFPCCKCCSSPDLRRESSYTRCNSKMEKRNSSTDSRNARLSEGNRKLLNVKMNGCGKYDTELSARDSLPRNNCRHSDVAI